MNYLDVWMSDEDWFNLGKADAWVGQSKQAPEQPQAASLYDLGYTEGAIERPPTESLRQQGRRKE
jgi:hypothetical protein